MPDGTKPLVLVVDDEPGVAKTLAWILEQSGYVSAVAYTGRDAIELGSRITAALAIVDVNLPDVDGIKVAAEISQILPSCKVLLITGDPDSAPFLEWLRLASVDSSFWRSRSSRLVCSIRFQSCSPNPVRRRTGWRRWSHSADAGRFSRNCMLLVLTCPYHRKHVRRELCAAFLL